MEDNTAKVINPSWVANQFQALQGGLNGERGSVFYALRKAAFETLQSGGFPAPNNEDWRHTNIAPYLSKEYLPASVRTIERAALEKFFAGKLPAQLVVLVNGHYDSALSSVSADGLQVVPLKEVIGGHASPELTALVAKHLGQVANPALAAFIALNASLMRDGAVITVDKAAVISEPLHIIQIAAGEDRTLICPRVFVHAAAQSNLEIVEHFISDTATKYLRAAVTEVVCEESSTVRHYKIQSEASDACHVGVLHVALKKDCGFTTFTMNSGGELVRNEIAPVLSGENISCLLHGITLAEGSQHIDNFTILDHAKPHCQSTEVFKGIYAGKSEGVFCGTIIVRPDAQKTNAIQSNQSILLSKEASIESKPQLKIWADDVKCTHGATVGELDAEALFYLRARGIGMEEARRMLVRAFASALVAEIPNSATRKIIESVLDNKLSKL